MSKEGFDLRTHIRDPKTGRVIGSQPYRLRVSREGGRQFERPVGSGVWYFEDGSLVNPPKEEKVLAPKEEKTAVKTLKG